MANTFTRSTESQVGVYKADWETKLQERLSKPVTYTEICDVRYSDAFTVQVPYMATEFVAQTGTRGTAYGFSDFTITNVQLVINTFKLVPTFADTADLAQCTYVDFMDFADRQGRLLQDQIETAVLADHTNWTNVGDSSGTIASGVATTITVTVNNIDDIVRGVRRIAIVANGTSLMKQNGLFFVWRPADFELLEQYAQANGYNLADAALKTGIDSGYFLLGAYHYVSNSHATNHVFAGVRKLHKVGILNATWGKLKINDQDPNLQSGTGLVTRADYGVLAPTGYTTLLYDVNVA